MGIIGLEATRTAIGKINFPIAGHVASGRPDAVVGMIVTWLRGALRMSFAGVVARVTRMNLQAWSWRPGTGELTGLKRDPAFTVSSISNQHPRPMLPLSLLTPPRYLLSLSQRTVFSRSEWFRRSPPSQLCSPSVSR